MKTSEVIQESFSAIKDVSLDSAQMFPVWHEEMMDDYLSDDDYDPDYLERILNMSRLVSEKNKAVDIIGVSPRWYDLSDPCIGVLIRVGKYKAGMSWWAHEEAVDVIESSTKGPKEYAAATVWLQRYIRYLAKYLKTPRNYQ